MRAFATFFNLLLVLGLVACAPQEMPQISKTAPEAAPEQGFALNAGDRLRITIFGDEDLSGEYDIDARGLIALPLAGEIAAQGLSVEALKDKITANLAEGDYLTDPKISIEVISLRPFYILGEVREPGSYPAFPELDVFKAIATAGGLTPRAVKGRYIIYRGFGENRVSIEADDATPILPGDSIRVQERFF